MAFFSVFLCLFFALNLLFSLFPFLFLYVTLSHPLTLTASPLLVSLTPSYPLTSQHVFFAAPLLNMSAPRTHAHMHAHTLTHTIHIRYTCTHTRTHTYTHTHSHT